MDKRCSRCKQEQPLANFPKSGGKGDLSGWCRTCHHDYYTRKKDLTSASLRMAPSWAEEWSGFPARLHEARTSRGMTQNALAGEMGTLESQVRLWEKGRALPRRGTLVKIHEFFGWPLGLVSDPSGRRPLGFRPCLTCGTDFPVYKAHVVHCSRKCSGRTMSQLQSGPANAGWKGGRSCSGGNGYIKVKVTGHPSADNHGYLMEHRLVMETVLGRHLGPKERVHHRNGRRNDNRPENLELWTLDHKDPAGVRAADVPHCPTCTCSSRI